MSDIQEMLRGTGVAIVTPFNARLEVDYPALERIIEYVIQGGVNYIVSLGTTGETPTLSAEEKTEIILFTFEKVAGRVPVVVGLGDYHTADVVKRLKTCPLDQAIAVLSVSPYYNKPSQEGLYQHYKAIAEASPKPVIIYNVPGRTGRNVSVQTILRLAELDNIVGVKEASGDLQQCMELAKHKPHGFLLLSGDDALALAQIACGFEGVISVAANCFPREMSELIRFALAERFSEARQLHYRLLDAFQMMFAENNPAGIKAFMSEAGLCENMLRLPLVPVSASLHQQIRDYMRAFQGVPTK
ncbi:4-hydroxy-tetrahydrodipicolinate synthase [Thermoflavifilum thermophilum]|uniref:4-hydroxy-tetrahydrodipicolinate synthase n=1 Tax=Thermoflavifilum thermophilum TaxID=1393122 RepID=A0A1I7NHK7_9BACT|nr:4-hydroxy-tetrahydrodipicolinate synthase [Thermoflavifilum thermophilum]SFV34138.1 4-hydroxy-tetrahydrodipicolinate synthase [Thermoflavifilum thermophilum]